MLKKIDRAYKKFFRNRERGIKSSISNFNKLRDYKSFTLTQSGYKLLNGKRIKIGVQTFKYSKSQDIQYNIKSLTVKRDRLGDIRPTILVISA